MDFGTAVGFMAAGGLIVWGLWMLSEHFDPRERVNFKDLTVGQIDKFFTAIVDHRTRTVLAVTHGIPPEHLLDDEEPVEPDLDDWDQPIVATPDIPNIAPGAEPDISQVIVGAARAWRQGMPGAEVTLTHWVDVLEENLNRPEAGGHLRPEAQHHPIGSATSEP